MDPRGDFDGPARPIRLLLGDDHTLLRETLRDLLESDPSFRVVGEAGDAEGVLRLVVSREPDIVLLDARMPGPGPVGTVREIQRLCPRTKVVIMTMYADRDLVRELVALGIHGFLHKGVGSRELLGALRVAAGTGDRVTISVPRSALMTATGEPAASAAPAAVAHRAVAHRTADDGAEGPLSQRQLEVLELVAQAFSNRQIAGHLAITEGTVKRHLRNIFTKLDAVSRVDAVNKAKAAVLITG